MLEEASRLREDTRVKRLEEYRLASDARARNLKDEMPVKLIYEVFRFKIDTYVLDHLFVEERRPNSARKR
jgi:hypothetical protein